MPCRPPHKGGDCALGLGPNLRTGGAIMDQAVGDVIKLIRPEPPFGLRQPPGNMIIIARIG